MEFTDVTFYGVLLFYQWLPTVSYSGAKIMVCSPLKRSSKALKSQSETTLQMSDDFAFGNFKATKRRDANIEIPQSATNIAPGKLIVVTKPIHYEVFWLFKPYWR